MGSIPKLSCGDDKDDDTLWNGVQHATPNRPAPNMEVRIPEPPKCGYAIRNGDDDKLKGPHNLLFIPTVRISGIECEKILGDTYINFWKYAWQEGQQRWPKLPLMLGINSFHGRSHCQLHIHLTGFFGPAHDALTKIQKNIGDVSKWNDPGSRFVLPTNPTPAHPSTTPYAYRIAHVGSLNDNLFSLLKNRVVGSGNDMYQQSLGVVSAPGGGFYLINTEGKPDDGEVRHSSDLKNVDHHSGTQTVEGLMDRG